MFEIRIWSSAELHLKFMVKVMFDIHVQVEFRLLIRCRCQMSMSDTNIRCYCFLLQGGDIARSASCLRFTFEVNVLCFLLLATGTLPVYLEVVTETHNVFLLDILIR